MEMLDEDYGSRVLEVWAGLGSIDAQTGIDKGGYDKWRTWIYHSS